MTGTYLCVEDGEFFTIQARDIKEARFEAATWGAQVIREVLPQEEK